MTYSLSALLEPVDESWMATLETQRATLESLVQFLNDESNAGRKVLPPAGQILRALSIPRAAVRVLIVGQDPYPTPGNAVGLAFSVAAGTHPLPGSVRNILTELRNDIDLPIPSTGDLSHWTERGVMLLNRVLTVPAGVAGGHRGRGWERVTKAVIQDLNSGHNRFVAALWGRDAQLATPFLDGVPIVFSAHPSPLSAYRGFLGSRPFSAINRELVALGLDPVDWSLP